MNMRTIFHPNINSQRKKRKKILIGALIALILMMIIFYDFSFRILNRPVFYVLSPFLKMEKNFDDWREKISTGFKEKKSLLEENNNLREKKVELEMRIASLEIIDKENAELKSFFAVFNSTTTLKAELKKTLLASVIFRPPQTPYDIIIIDAGAEEGIKEGYIVAAFENVLLGYVEDVFADTAKIRLISSFGEETSALMDPSKAPVIVIGKGGENFEITLPAAVPAETGNKIITLGKQPMLIGIIERIEHPENSPFQKIMFRLPVNIQYLSKVFVSKK